MVEQVPTRADERIPDFVSTDREHPHEIESFPSSVTATKSLEPAKLGGLKLISQIDAEVPAVRCASMLKPQRSQTSDMQDGKDWAEAWSSPLIHVDKCAV